MGATLQGPSAPPLNKILFSNADLTVGTFTAKPSHPAFEDSGPIDQHLLAFPSAAVWIDDLTEPRFVADPNLATFYNRGHRYRRRALAPEGDVSVWIAPSIPLLRDTLSQAGHVADPRAPFSWRHRYVPPRAFCLQQALYRHLASGVSIEKRLVVEAVQSLLASLVPVATGSRPLVPARQRLRAERTKALLDERFTERLSQGEIARLVGCSRFHLARIFRASVGLSIHGYRDQLRLRAALLRLPTAASLTTLALDLGYDSHSHFSSRFRRTFGITPSALRDLDESGLPDLIDRFRRLDHGLPSSSEDSVPCRTRSTVPGITSVRPDRTPRTKLQADVTR